MPWRSIESPRSRPGLSVLGLGLLFAGIVVSALFWSARAERAAAEHSEAQLSLANLAANVNRLDAMEWRIIATGEIEAEVAEELEHVRDRSRALLRSLASDLVHGGSSPDQARDLFESYSAAVDLEIRLVAEGDVKTAERVDEEQVDPAFELLHDDIEQLQDSFRVQAERDESTATVLGYAAIGAAVLIAIALLIRSERVRQRAAFAAARHALEQRIHDSRRELLSRTVEATETERRRIAADLHDGPVQRLTALTLSLQRLRRRVKTGDRAEAMATAADLQERLADEITSIREVMTSLRPPALDEKGLGAAIRDLAGAFERRTGTPCSVEACADERLEPEVETVLYRVTQEVLANVARHARASKAGVALSRKDGVVSLEAWDDGVGFDTKLESEFVRNGHLGLAAMQERVQMAGGTWTIRSSRGSGTRVRVAVPVVRPSA